METSTSGFPTFNTQSARLAWFKQKLKTSAGYAMRACEVIYEYQTAQEKEVENTVEDNGVGFGGVDGGILSSFAVQIAKNKAAKAAGIFPAHYGLLSPKQTAVLHKLMPKYAGQLIGHLEESGKLPSIAKMHNPEFAGLTAIN